MKPSEYEAIGKIFLQVRKADSGQRERELDRLTAGREQLRPEVEALLRMDAVETQAFDAPLFSELQQRSDEAHALASVPSQIGKYRVTGFVAEGGMGTVFEAEQEQPQRTVALKVLRAGTHSLERNRRFETEVQVLGRLQHPGIARIYDAGSFEHHGERKPYLVMELVRGGSLSQVIEDDQLNTAERVRLLVSICEAIQHAHQRGVIHRDLKPSNVLVDDAGNIKIVDFGIARAGDLDLPTAVSLTRCDSIVGTLEYMSPEQASCRHDAIDARTDVYALGVLAHELLTGERPLVLRGLPIHEAVRKICEDEPTVSGVLRSLHTDLATIIRKALHKDAVQRYASASQLAADLERYLRHEPITARPLSPWYLLRTFTRRHRALVASVVLGFATLTIGLSYGLYQQIQRTEEVRESNEAYKRALQEAEAVAGLMVSLVSSGEENPQGLNPSLKEALDRAAAAALAETDVPPLVEGRLCLYLGMAYLQFRDLQRSRDFLDRAVELYDGALGAAAPRSIRARYQLARWQVAAGEFENAEAELEQLLEHVSEDRVRLRMSATLGDLYAKTSRFDEAQGLLRRTLSAQQKLFGHEDVDALVTMVMLSEVHVQKRVNTDAARQLLEKVLVRRQAMHGQDSSSALAAEHRIARWCLACGDYETAAQSFESLIPRADETFGRTSTFTAELRRGLGKALYRSRRFTDAERIQAEGLECYERLHGPQHVLTLRMKLERACSLVGGGRRDEAREEFDGLAEWLRRSSSDSPRVQVSLAADLGVAYARLFRNNELAEEFLELAASVRVPRLGKRHPLTLELMQNLGTVRFRRGRYQDAKSMIRETLALRSELLGEDHKDTQRTLGSLAHITYSRRDFDVSEECYKRLAEHSERQNGARHARTLGQRASYAIVLRAQSKLAASRREMEDVVEIASKVLEESHSGLALYHVNLADSLQALGETDAALALLRKSEGRLEPARVGRYYRVLGYCLRDKGDLEGAARALEAALPKQRGWELELAREALGDVRDSLPKNLTTESNGAG